VVVSVECAGRRVVAVTDQIRAVAKERLRERLAVASSSDLVAVEAALRRILELS
jgi:mRNA-degrading endonuclease toxin of MazEF toxin-antitoxin module